MNLFVMCNLHLCGEYQLDSETRFRSQAVSRYDAAADRVPVMEWKRISTPMPRRFFRKFAVKREWFHKQWYLAPFDHLLHDRNLWGIRRHTVVPAFAIGLFVAFVPLPAHALIAVLLALVLRVNIPVAAISTLICNPVTVYPMYFLAYRVGLVVLRLEPRPFEFEFSIAWVSDSFVNIWQPLVLGCLLLGSLLALLGYTGLNLLWRTSIVSYLRRKRKKREQC